MTDDYDRRVSDLYDYPYGSSRPRQIDASLVFEDAFPRSSMFRQEKDVVEPDYVKPRPQEEGRQMVLGEHLSPTQFNHQAKAWKPTDPVLHDLRRQNPALNDYRVESDFDYTGGSVKAYHKDEAKDSIASSLTWNGPDRRSTGYDDEEYGPGEVGMVRTTERHRGKGLATALWDYAMKSPQFEEQRPVHSKNRSAAGYGWSQHVGGEEYDRTDGHGQIYI